MNTLYSKQNKNGKEASYWARLLQCCVRWWIAKTFYNLLLGVRSRLVISIIHLIHQETFIFPRTLNFHILRKQRGIKGASQIILRKPEAINCLLLVHYRPGQPVNSSLEDSRALQTFLTTLIFR